MDGQTLQAKIYAGYARSAQHIGLDFDLYRPASIAAPLSNKVGTLKAAMDSSASYSFKAPNEYGDPTWFALINDATTQPGDYLVNGNGTYFIAGKQFLLPVIVVECNRQVRVSRQPAPTGVGAVGYGGPCGTAGDIDVIGSTAGGTAWPCSILLKGQREKSLSALPGASSQVGWQILLPPSVAVPLNAGDIATDDLGRRYLLHGAEQSDLGWRLTCTEVHA
ncbi:hypothetical protein [Chitinimonas naiadis]